MFSLDEGVEEVPLGLYLVKGDMMYVVNPFILGRVLNISYSALVGEVDAAIDESVDLSTIRADPIPPIRY